MSSDICHQGGKSEHGVVVIGAGVIGLTTALTLRRKGFPVTVVAEHFAPQVTSVVAGALWEWPPAICGRHNDEASLERAKNWCMVSYAAFAELSRDPATGVFIRPVTFYFKRPVAEDVQQRRKMVELAGKVRGFRHDATLIAENGVNSELGLQDAYQHLAPMIDTDAYMRWLLEAVRAAGCGIVQRKVSGNLLEQASTLRREFDAAILVNCAGLGARALGDASVFPLRGALVRIRNDGKRMPRLSEAHCVADDGPGRFVFVVPRGEDMMVLGGLAEPEEWGLDVGLHNYEPIRQMYQRCVEFLPALAAAQIDPSEQVRVGLRPFRAGGARLEVDKSDSRIVHNYGHGGSGITLSWGCAAEVANLVAMPLSSAKRLT